MDFLLAGTLFSLFMEFQCRVIVQRGYVLSAARLWKTFRSKPNAIPVGGKNCSPSHRNHVHFQTEMLFGITTEWCSPSTGFPKIFHPPNFGYFEENAGSILSNGLFQHPSLLTTFAARQQATRRVFFCYCTFAYSALACFRMGMSVVMAGSLSYTRPPECAANFVGGDLVATD